MKRVVLSLIALALAGAGCRDLQRFSTRDDHFEGEIAKGEFIRAGFAGDVKLCLTLDADRLQDAPGTISSTDGRFRATPLRPIPQVWNDPLATLEFGTGRSKNMIYAATPAVDGGAGEDVMVVVSLMESNEVEVRMLRGAPPQADAAPPPSPNLFGVFRLKRREGPCAF
jgi:hypothetical protein